MKTSDFTGSPERPRTNYFLITWIIGITLLCFFFFPYFSGGIYIGIKKAQESERVQKAHAIGLALFSYANDNDQRYPDASSSTEAFQKLIDGGYITDPTVLYIPMPGKVKPMPGQKLKPENVSWDLTAPVDAASPNGLPLLFMTGYKINYVSGGAAMPLTTPPPQYGVEGPPLTWFQQLFTKPSIDYRPSEGIAVFYVNNSAAFHSVAADNSIPNFIPPDFKPDGTNYRQLTPDGVLR